MRIVTTRIRASTVAHHLVAKNLRAGSVGMLWQATSNHAHLSGLGQSDCTTSSALIVPRQRGELLVAEGPVVRRRRRRLISLLNSLFHLPRNGGQLLLGRMLLNECLSKLQSHAFLFVRFRGDVEVDVIDVLQIRIGK